MQTGQGISMPQYDSHTGMAQSQGAVGAVAGAPKPRVRARRGQATDPHSIAERLRRERIAERMKALQELVPNSNKTDKASMLDEIIEYVKFLQLQVKVLSMSRLGGAAAVAPLVADLPAEGKNTLVAAALGQNSGSSQDAMAAAEHEVASLMEEDMGTAMQYLQSKGLCLMPISLATAISTTNSSQTSNSQVEQGLSSSEQLQMGMLSSFLAHSNSVAASLVMPPATGAYGINASNANNDCAMNQRANMQPVGAGISNGSVSLAQSSTLMNGLKMNMDTST